MITKEILYGWWFPWTPRYGVEGIISIGFGYFRISFMLDCRSWTSNVLQTGIQLFWNPNMECKEFENPYFGFKEWILDEVSLKARYINRIRREIE